MSYSLNWCLRLYVADIVCNEKCTSLMTNNAGVAHGDRGEAVQPVLLLHWRLAAPGDPLVQGRLCRGGGGQCLQGGPDQDGTKHRSPHSCPKKGGQLAIITNRSLKKAILLSRTTTQLTDARCGTAQSHQTGSWKLPHPSMLIVSTLPLLIV